MKDITILSSNWIHVLLILVQKQQGKEYCEEQILSALYLCICICVFLYLHLWEKKCSSAWWIAFCLLFTILAPFLSTWTNHLSASLLPSIGKKVYFLHSRRLLFVSVFLTLFLFWAFLSVRSQFFIRKRLKITYTKKLIPPPSVHYYSTKPAMYLYFYQYLYLPVFVSVFVSVFTSICTSISAIPPLEPLVCQVVWKPQDCRDSICFKNWFLFLLFSNKNQNICSEIQPRSNPPL